MIIRPPLTRILLVDDDPVFLGRAHQALDPFARLQTVSNGCAALQTLSQWQPDVVLFDLLLNDLDGFTFLEIINRSGLERRPFILCTTDGRGADTRIRPLPNWDVGTLVRSSSIVQLRTAVLQAARCQDPAVQRHITA